MESEETEKVAEMFLDSTEDRQEQMEIVVIDVTRNNFTTIWPAMMLAIKNSKFIAVDLELSGLGDRKQLSVSSIDERYNALCTIARSRSIISFGLACFQQIPSKEDNFQRKYKIQVFNLFLLCDDEYIVESQSLQFLVKHGFDFNKQYSSGIPYKKGNQKKVDQHTSIRRLFLEIVMAKVPLVVHNGFIDLVFMYQCFYSDLPSSLQTFVADIYEMFPLGIYDTKYISEYHVREKLSVLEYLFRKCQHKNESEKSVGKLFIDIESKTLHGNRVDEEVVSCVLPSLKITESCKQYVSELCKSFQERGFCPSQNSCTKIHSVDLVIISEEVIQQKKSRSRSRKRRKPNDNGDNEPEAKMAQSEMGVKEINPPKKARKDDTETAMLSENDNGTKLSASFAELSLPRTSGHRAGFDAFMTGYCFAFYETGLSKSKEATLEESCNKVYLTAKDMPLTIMKSHFVQTSSNHKKIMADFCK